MRVFSFFKNLSWLIGLNLLIKPLWIFAIDRQVQNVVGHEAYGNYFALYGFTYVLAFIADAGLSTMLNQQIASSQAINVRQLFRLKILLLFIYVVVCLVLAWLIQAQQWQILFYLIAIQGLTSVFIFLRSLLTANQYFKQDAWFSVIDKGLLIIASSGFLYGLFRPINLTIFLQLQLSTITLSVIAILLFLNSRKVFSTEVANKTTSLIKRIIPFAVIILFMSVHTRLDAFLLQRMHPNGAVEAGIFAAAYRLLDAANMLGYLAASFLVPFIARQQNNKPVVEKTILYTRHGLLTLAIGGAAFIWVFAPALQAWLYHTLDTYTNQVLQYCLLALPAYYLIHIYGALLTGAGELKTFVQILFLALIINIGLNIFFVPQYGAWGCCMAALVSQYTCAFALCIGATKKLQIAYGIKSILAYFLWAGLLLVSFYALKNSILNVWIILAVFITLVVVWLSLWKERIRQLLSSFNF